jgi:hypothetical protein
MTSEEYLKLLADLEEVRTAHREKFKRWYDQADYPAVEYYCETGWLIDRVLRRHLEVD